MKLQANYITINNQIMELKEKQEPFYRELSFSRDINNVQSLLIADDFNKKHLVSEYYSGKEKLLIKLYINENTEEKIERLKNIVEGYCKWKIIKVLDENNQVINFDESIYNIDLKFIIIQYEPMFDVEIISHAISVLYYVSNINISEKIKKIGLNSRIKNNIFSCPNKTHLSDNVDNAIDLIKTYVKTKEKSETFVIFKVRINSNFISERLFKDSIFKGRYYTLEEIDKDDINPILKIEFDNSGNILKKENL